MLQLIKPDIEYKESFEEFLESFGKFSSIHGVGLYDKDYDNFNNFLKHIEKMFIGKNIGNKVASSTLWLLEDEAIIGTIDIRHELNEFLLKRGGHIGYSIHPNYRGKGYGKEILRLGLIKSKDLGIENILITCDESNIASEKIILTNGGVYENTIEGIKRYWINN